MLCNLKLLMFRVFMILCFIYLCFEEKFIKLKILIWDEVSLISVFKKKYVEEIEFNVNRNEINRERHDLNWMIMIG